MIKLIGLGVCILCIPSAFVIATRLKRYIDIKLSEMEARRYREIEEDYRRPL